MRETIKKLYKIYNTNTLSKRKKSRIINYLENGQVPWSEGYDDYKWQQIIENINNSHLSKAFLNNTLPLEYGVKIDERIVEYPWLLSNLSENPTLLLDAGSTFNFAALLDHPKIINKRKIIYTYHPESFNYNDRGISYLYGDLRELPFKNNLFDEIICQSTIEHIGMDNSIYGYQIAHDISSKEKNDEYLKVIDELVRVLKPGGLLLLTFPFGKFENHGFFQQLDTKMSEKIFTMLSQTGTCLTAYFKYISKGWILSNRLECEETTSYNPHTGEGKGKDGAAHSRAICCVKFIKTK